MEIQENHWRKIKKMAIWVISKYASTPLFGRATRQFYFAKHFKKITNKSVYLIGSRSALSTNYPNFNSKNHIEFSIENVEVNILNGPKINGGFNLLRFWSWVEFEVRFLFWGFKYKGEKPELLLVSSLSILTILSGIILKWKYRSKLVFEIRDIYPLTLMELKKWSKYHPVIFVLGVIEKIGYNKSDYIVGTMPNLREHIKNVSLKNVEKVCFMPMGFDEMYFSNTKNKNNIFDIFFKQNSLNNKFIVGYAGSIGKVNCIDQIIISANYLKNENVAFVIVGDGPLKDLMIELTNKYNLTNVYFHDEVKREEVLLFLLKCDVLLHAIGGNNKLYAYGVSPNKWIDYMYSAKPIIVSYDGYQSIINEAKCGFFVPANNPELLAMKISEVSKMTSEKLREIGDNGKAYLLNNLRYNNLAQKYLSICNYNLIENI